MLLLLLTVIGAVVLVLVEMRKKRTSIKTVGGETILVVLPMYRPSDPVRVLDSLFRQAACPSRVHVAVLEHNLPNTETAVDAYYSAQERHITLPFAHNIQYEKGKIETIFGPSVARQFVMDHLYKNERYVLFLSQNAQLLPKWDTLLIDSLMGAYAIGAHVVSQFPPTTSTTHHVPSTFPVFDRFNKQGLPVFRGRFVSAPQQQPFRTALATWQCLFARADLVLQQQLHTPGLPFLRSPAADLLLSAELWTQGYGVVAPTSSILVTVGKNEYQSWRDTKNTQLKSFTQEVVWSVIKDQPLQPTPSYQKKVYSQPHRMVHFLKWLHLDVLQQQIAGQTLLGLTPNYTTMEIVQKYGSLERFQQFKEKYSYV
jgi:hypothetical protein